MISTLIQAASLTNAGIEKIDLSFIREVLTNPQDQAIVKATILLAKSLGLSVVAEGIEKEAQLSFVKTHGCDYAQGYLFSKPLEISELPDWVKTYQDT